MELPSLGAFHNYILPFKPYLDEFHSMNLVQGITFGLLGALVGALVSSGHLSVEPLVMIRRLGRRLLGSMRTFIILFGRMLAALKCGFGALGSHHNHILTFDII